MNDTEIDRLEEYRAILCERIEELEAEVERLKTELHDSNMERAHYGDIAALKLGLLENEIERLRAERRWVSVEERLPDTSDDVLILLTYESIYGYIVIGRCMDGRWHGAYSGQLEDGEVRAWMPLPQPPVVQP
jgi:uncharacterized small protein (DUF1192 family)